MTDPRGNQLPLFDRPPEKTLEQARRELFAQIRDGVDCPCCDQLAKVYKRKLNSVMARSLIAFFQEEREFPKQWFHALDVLQRRMPSVQGSGDYAKLAYWGLIVAKRDETDDSNSAGRFRLTEKGKHFVLTKGMVPKHIYLFNDRQWPTVPEEIEYTTIKEALGADFNYEELMNA